MQSLKTGKEHPDERVVNSLYSRAIGYSYDAVKIFMHEGKPVKVPYREHVPSDVTACIFWLKNRRPDLWRDRHDLAAIVKTPEDTRPVQQQWDDLIRRMISAGAIKVVPDDLIPEPRPILGIARPNGDGSSG